MKFIRHVYFLFFALLIITQYAFTQTPSLKIAKLKYNGGGDWYANKTSLPNLIAFCNRNLKTNLFPEEDVVEVGRNENEA